MQSQNISCLVAQQIAGRIKSEQKACPETPNEVMIATQTHRFLCSVTWQYSKISRRNLIRTILTSLTCYTTLQRLDDKDPPAINRFSVGSRRRYPAQAFCWQIFSDEPFRVRPFFRLQRILRHRAPGEVSPSSGMGAMKVRSDPDRLEVLQVPAQRDQLA